VVNDARNFFESTDERFDLILFGLLDSHTTPGFTNVRLDNFVYTRESIEQAKSILAPGGTIALMFEAQVPFLQRRISTTLHDVFGEWPRIARFPAEHPAWGGWLFVAGGLDKVDASIAAQPELAAKLQKIGFAPAPAERVEPTSDDWPYLYLPEPTIPKVFILIAVLLLTLWFIMRRKGDLTGSLGTALRIEFMALGAAFTLLQAYGLNKLALLFGSTWVTNATVSTGIIVMILFSNLLYEKFPKFPIPLIGAGLLFTCGINLLLKITALSSLPYLVQLAGSGLFIGLPVIFSGLLFARAFAGVQDPGRALGSNLFGSVIGGILQLGSVYFGIRALLYLVLVAYSVALISALKHEDKV
jgi:hypothetical protein